MNKVKQLLSLVLCLSLCAGPGVPAFAGSIAGLTYTETVGIGVDGSAEDKTFSIEYTFDTPQAAVSGYGLKFKIPTGISLINTTTTNQYGENVTVYEAYYKFVVNGTEYVNSSSRLGTPIVSGEIVTFANVLSDYRDISGFKVTFRLDDHAAAGATYKLVATEISASAGIGAGESTKFENVTTTITVSDPAANSKPTATPTPTPPAESTETPAAANPFTDVSPSGAYAYAYDAILWAYESGVTRGATATTFNPGGSCTRAQFVTFLWRAAGSPEPPGANGFTDVYEAAHADYYKAILWAVEQGVTLGTGDGTTFSPGQAVTRAQAVTFMYRYHQKTGLAAKNGESAFTDVAKGAFYEEAVGWAVANGITNGNSAAENTFGPNDSCIRAQMVTFLYRFFTDAAA